jgi:hypothetical protein
MTEDARFEDGRERPLNLGAEDGEDLKVIAALTQDAVLEAKDVSWRPKERRLALLVNRFRWEDRGMERHGPERVRSLLVIENVLKVASQGIDPKDREMVLSLLSIDFEADAEPPSGAVLLTFAGDGALRLTVEALDVSLKDVTRPYRAPSGKVPSHE